ncbi:DUF4038 domain-containing protein, partial [bacterium]|nr:DUF4038 domain-containing protein [bacterium]
MKKLLVCTVLLISFFFMNSTNLMAVSPLQVSANGRFIVKTDNSPFFPQNDWATSLPWKLNTTNAASYLAARKAQGFNIVSMQAVKNCDSMADYIATTNVAGIAPFQLVVDGDYKNRWDVTKPIEAYWSAIDSIIDIAATQGLYISLVPLPTSGLLLGTYRVMPRGDDSTAYAFGNWIGARYADKTNIIWLAGAGSCSSEWLNVTSQVNALAKGITDGVNGTSNNVGVTDYSTTLMTYEPQRWTHSSSYWFHNEEWLDFNSIDEVPQRDDKPQCNQVTEITGDYNKTPLKPTWLFGPVSEGSHDFGPWQCRFQVYQTLFAGGFGASYGNRNVQSFNSGWDTNINTESAMQMQYVTALMTSSASNYTFLARIPDQNLIVGDTGEITQPGDWYQRVSTIIQATRTEDGKYAMIYSANGRDITVSMSKLDNGTMSAKWYNPRIGGLTTISGSISSGLGTDNVTFDPPGETSDPGNDWVLVLDLVAGPAPIDPI